MVRPRHKIGWKGKVDAYFRITERRSTLGTELFAGFINFVANSYLLVLVPQMTKLGGVDKPVATTGFAIATFVSSMLVGMLANLPIPAGPGLGCATYFAYSLSKLHGDGGGLDNSPDASYALNICFIAGCVMLGLALLHLPTKIFEFVPPSVKEAMPVGLGLLLALCGFQQIGVVAEDPQTGLTTGELGQLSVILGMMGVFLMGFLEVKHFKASFLIPIVVFTLAAWIFGVSPLPKQVLSVPSIGHFLDLSRLDQQALGPVFAIYLICLFDCAGIMYSVSRVADLVRQDNSVPGAYWLFVACSVGTIVSAFLGCTPCIVFGESFAGVLVGGKTGLSAAFMGFCFLLTLPFSPILSAVPLFASAPVLVVLGVTLVGLLRHLNWDDFSVSLPSFLTISLMPYLYSIDRAIIAGLCAHIILCLLDFLYSPLENGKVYWARLVNTVLVPQKLLREISPREREPSMLEDFLENKVTTLQRKVKGHATTMDDLRRLFAAHDVENVGTLASKDLADLALSLGSQLSHAELEEAVSLLDSSRTGRITFADFARWWGASPHIGGGVHSPGRYVRIPRSNSYNRIGDTVMLRPSSHTTGSFPNLSKWAESQGSHHESDSD